MGPREHSHRLTTEFGELLYERIDAPATPEQKARLELLSSRRHYYIDARGRADHSQADQSTWQ